MKSSVENLIVMDKKRDVYLVNPAKNADSRKLFRLGFTPSHITYASIRKQSYLLVGRNDRIEVLNTKGSLVRRVPFKIENGKIIVLDKKLVLYNGNKCLVTNNQFVVVKDNISTALAGTTDILDANVGNTSNFILVKDNSVMLSTKEMQEKFLVKTSSQPVCIRTLNGNSKGFLVIDSQNNLYLFDMRGELSNGYPYNLRKATAVLTMDDGTLFAVTPNNGTLESRQIVANFPSIL